MPRPRAPTGAAPSSPTAPTGAGGGTTRDTAGTRSTAGAGSTGAGDGSTTRPGPAAAPPAAGLGTGLRVSAEVDGPPAPAGPSVAFVAGLTLLGGITVGAVVVGVTRRRAEPAGW